MALVRTSRRQLRSAIHSCILAALCATAAAAPAGAVLRVTGTTPVRHDLDVSPGLSEIWAIFNAPLATLPAGCVRVSGTMSGLHEGEVRLMDNVIIFENGSEPFFRGEMVVVNYRSEIQDVGGNLLTGGFSFAFTIASAPASVNWSAPLIFPTARIPYFIYGGDVDEDDRPDIAVPNEGTNDVSVFLNDFGLGTFPTHEEYGVGERPSSIFGEDFDNDGDQDLATADIGGGTVSVLLNNGDGTYAPRQVYAAGAQCRQIHGGDFDGDNDVDLCATAHQVNRLHIYYNNGDGTFTPAPPITNISPGPFAIRTGDLNLDGHLDIGVACQNSDVLDVFMNNGTGGFNRTGTYTIGDGPWCLNGNDMDGDGDFDLISVASYADRIVVLFNDGAGGFPNRATAVTLDFPLGVFAADLDGDGDIDATSSNFSGDATGVYLNPGNGQIALQTNLPTEASSSYTWAHDLDADGDLDLSTVDENADLLFIFYNGPVPADVAPVGAAPARGGALLASPSPVRAGTGSVITLSGFRGATDVDLISVDGRLLRRIWTGIAAGEERRISWHAQEAGVTPGSYLMRARSAAGEEASFRLVITR